MAEGSGSPRALRAERHAFREQVAKDAFEDPSCAAPAAVEPTAPPGDVVCRLCYEGSEDEELGRLFRPCVCRGSMSHVHVRCLENWRRLSQNPKALYECGVCHYKYRFGMALGADRLVLFRLLTSPFFAELASLLALLLIAFLAGFVAKGFAVPTWREVLIVDRTHWLYGLSATGAVSLLSWGVVSIFDVFGTAPLRVLEGGSVGHGKRALGRGARLARGDDDGCERVILAILVAVGLMLALCWIYGRVKELTQWTLFRYGQRILEVPPPDDA
jgi:hypothetical protein